MRSKSELNIANMLYMKGIPYHYEELVRLDGYTVAADFKIAVHAVHSVRLFLISFLKTVFACAHREAFHGSV